MHTSKIEWVLNPDNKTLGKIWNPITGCLNGCPYCYARKLANGRLRGVYLNNPNVANYDVDKLTGEQKITMLENPFYPRFWPERLREGIFRLGKKPKGIFVCDMGELFGDWIPEEWIKKVLAVTAVYPQHRFYLLTKQPQNLRKFSPFPENCWVGVTATNYDMFITACGELGALKAKGEETLVYISLEPLLSWDSTPGFTADWLRHGEISWIILGAQTKPAVYPELEWVREIVEAADKAGIPVFLKDNLKPLLLDYWNDKPLVSSWMHRGEFRDFDIRLRQEMPTR